MDYNQLFAMLCALLLTLSGYVHFDHTAPFETPNTMAFTVHAENECVTPYSLALHCAEKNTVIRTGGATLEEIITAAPKRALYVLRLMVHELLHGYDQFDNGFADGSPGHPWSPAAEQASGYQKGSHCLSSMAEWFVCRVLDTGKLN